MKISYNWLKQYLDLDPTEHSAEVLAEVLPLLGFDIETLEHNGPPALEKVVVGEVIEYEQHPNADRLRCCKVSTGGVGEPHKIVCGAKNFEAGDRVMVALPGAVLPGDFKIKKSKLRGEPSEGMLCSAKELNLGQDHEGILILNKEQALGTPLNEIFHEVDTILDLEITPNRVDVLSHIGLAREVAARFNLNVNYPEVKASTTNPSSGAVLLESVELQAGNVCPHYTAFCIRGVKVGPSPEWLVKQLESVGLRSVNNVVDVTNFVLHETGQPMHAFDAAKIKGKKLLVRKAGVGEVMTTLDGVERKLSIDDLVVADSERPLALAGVMGGVDAEVGVETVDVVLETAYFNPSTIRASSRRIGLVSDSSYRFERGIDAQGLLYASLRAVDLILECAGGSLDGDRLVAGSEPLTQKAIQLCPDEVRRFIGFKISNESMCQILTSLNLDVCERTESDGSLNWEVKIPSYRGDLEREVDLIEEVVRLYGTDRIPETEVHARGIEAQDHRAYTISQEVAAYMTGQNFHEAFLYSLRDPQETQVLFGEKALEHLKLANPLQSDQSHLRSCLLPGLIDVLQLNTARGTGAMRFFERGRIFKPSESGMMELLAFGFVLTGASLERAWKDHKAVDFYTAKSLCENIASLAGFPVAKLVFEPQETSPLWQGGQSATSGELMRQGVSCTAGLLNVVTLRDRWSLEYPIIAGIVEINPETFQRGVKRARHSAISNQPASIRDIALVVDQFVLAGRVQSDLVKFAKKAVSGFTCEAITCFDIYEGDGLPEGKKSLALSFSFRAMDRTLKDKEINAAFQAIQEQIESQTDYQIRK
ncbi:MAG: Phenylalanine--tRNA ligase beta subunit [Opitutia bacterium UBA7350]|nr:MAG: Phenylalanine--tRNA ligase beta subunit [Opitutae bacterium UBA7350]